MKNGFPFYSLEEFSHFPEPRVFCARWAMFPHQPDRQLSNGGLCRLAFRLKARGVHDSGLLRPQCVSTKGQVSVFPGDADSAIHCGGTEGDFPEHGILLAPRHHRTKKHHSYFNPVLSELLSALICSF